MTEYIVDFTDAHDAWHAAKRAAEDDYRVFPIEAKNQHVIAWRHGRRPATTSVRQIDRWWGRDFPCTPGYGIATGYDLLVLDVDGEVGALSLARVQEEHGPLPETRTVRTQSGGQHFYFWCDEPLRNTAGQLGVGLDTRGEGGYVVGQGSFGNAYTLVVEGDPAKAPDWLVQALLATSAGQGGAPAERYVVQGDADTYVDQAVEDDLAEIRTAERGERNHVLNTKAYNLGRWVGGGHLTETQAHELLLDAATRAGIPSSEAQATIRSGLKSGREKPRRAVSSSPATAEEEDAALAKELRQLRVRDQARDILAAEKADRLFVAPDGGGLLRDLLAVERPPLQYTIDRLHPQGSSALIAAQYKVGKTTLMVNLVKSYADGDKFLGEFEMKPGAGRIALFNYELTEDMLLDEYLRPLEIENPDRVAVLNLRGRNFDLRSPTAMAWAVRWLKDQGCDALVLDPFGAAARLTNENDNSEARNWLLGYLDPLKEAAGIRDLWMPAHTGRAAADEGSEHVRGASSVDDWADVRWMYTKAEINDEGTRVWRRYLRAEGRGVDVPERELAFDKDDHYLYVSEYRSRGRARVESGLSALLEIVAEHPGIKAGDLRDALRGKNETKSLLLREAQDQGLVQVKNGPNKAKFFYPADGGESQ